MNIKSELINPESRIEQKTVNEFIREHLLQGVLTEELI
jgi:hypothetical protein